MVAGHLNEKNGFYYMILNLTDSNGKRKPKWIATGLPVKGNKKKAEAMLMEERQKHTQTPTMDNENLLFVDYLEQWLDIAKSSVELVTYSSYCTMVKGTVMPYFRDKKITLKGLQAKDIQDFYQEQLKRVKATTVIHYHANIHKALKHAVKMGLIDTNPADKVDRPKKDKFIGSFYDSDEINQLFDVAKGTRLELAVLLGAFYGLRRSEIVGLKWNAIDFKNNTIAICHTVTSCSIDGKHIEIAKDRTKSKASLRILPLVPYFREKLLKVQNQQDINRRLCGRDYISEYIDYIYVDELGERIKPGYITNSFPLLLEKNNLRRIRFHDLRHPYVKHTTKIFSLRSMAFQAQAYPDARRKTRGACQLHRGGQSQSPVRPLCNRKRFS